MSCMGTYIAPPHNGIISILGAISYIITKNGQHPLYVINRNPYSVGDVNLSVTRDAKYS